VMCLCLFPVSSVVSVGVLCIAMHGQTVTSVGGKTAGAWIWEKPNAYPVRALPDWFNRRVPRLDLEHVAADHEGGHLG
jgi:hypothetical protein